MFDEPDTLFELFKLCTSHSTIDTNTFWHFSFCTSEPKDPADSGFQNPCLDRLVDTSTRIHCVAFLTKSYEVQFTIYFTQLQCHALSRSYLQKMAEDILHFSFHNFTSTAKCMIQTLSRKIFLIRYFLHEDTWCG